MAVQKFKIRFVSQGAPNGEAQSMDVEFDPLKPKLSGTGEAGSVLDIALAHGVEIDHACGGVCACSTCHIIVREGLDSCPQSSEEEEEEEEDRLDNAVGVTPQSRLACQCVPSGKSDLVIEVPGWNRNLVREGH
ncbi:2Fe-2S iron-sulfur cluster-binding protein [Bdellovibrionota bacterium FG-2]